MTRGDPRVQYARTYVLLPPDATLGELLAAQQQYYGPHYTIGRSADDAGVGNLDARRVIAIDPGRWPSSLRAFFEQYYPGVEFVPVQSKPATLELGYPTTHLPPVITTPYTPTHRALDLRSSWKQWGDEVVCAFPGEVLQAGRDLKEPAYGTQVKTLTTIADGGLVLIRYAHLVDGGVYVRAGDHVAAGQRIGRPDSTGASTADHLHFDVRKDGAFVNPQPLIAWPGLQESRFPKLGLYDIPGGEYLAARGVEGWCVEPVYLGIDAKTLDYSALASRGIRVIANLRYSYALRDGGRGTIAPPNRRATFAQAVLDTIRVSKGVYAFTILNEVNNRDEWPEGCAISPSDVVELYNFVWRRAPAGVRIGPGALDPFHGQTGSVLDWWRQILGGIDDCSILDLHGYIRGPDPALVNSTAKFADDPMGWQCLNFYGCVDSLLKAVPTRFAGVEAIISEFNHLWLERGQVQPANPTLGWNPGATDVIQAACRRVLTEPRIAGLVLYRWDYDAWRMRDKPALLQKVVELNRFQQPL